MGICPLYYRHWKRVIFQVNDIKAEDSFCSFKTNGTARKIHTGCVGILAPVKEQLSVFVSHLREHNIRYSMHQRHGGEGGLTSCSFIRTEAYYCAGADSLSLHETHWLDATYGHPYGPETFPGNRRILKRLHCNDVRKDCRPGQGRHPKHGPNPHRVLLPLKQDSGHKRVKNYPCTRVNN